jgi:hypothetical protein
MPTAHAADFPMALRVPAHPDERVAGHGVFVRCLFERARFAEIRKTGLISAFFAKMTAAAPRP